MNNYIRFLKKNSIPILFILLLLFILIQHQFVYMYFDDYGYASLSYGYTGNTHGMNYTIGDLFSFLKWHYLNWGGRILYFFFEIISLRIGLPFIQVLQSVIIMGILFFSYMLARPMDKTLRVYCVILSILFYAAIGLTTFEDGIFWYTASVLYIWPLLPFLTACYIQKLSYNNPQKHPLLACLLFFLASFSQEQVAVMVIVYTFVMLGINIVSKQYIRVSIYNLIFAGVGGLLVILAPGNFVRAQDPMYFEFNHLNFFEKITTTLPKILDINLGRENTAFVCILLISSIVLAFLQKKTFSKRILYVSNIAVCTLFSALLPLSWFPVVAAPLCDVIMIIWALLYSINITIWLWHKKEHILLSMFYGGLCSQGMLIVSPSISTRSHTLFEIVLHIVTMYVFLHFFSQKKSVFKILITSVFGICSICNITPILIGFYNNSVIHELNHYKLLEKSYRIKNGEDISAIVLYRQTDDRYGTEQPYQNSGISVWMKNYYEIPQSVTLIFNELDEASNIHESIETDSPVLASVWPDSIQINDEIKENNGIAISATPEIISHYLEIEVNGEILKTTINNNFISAFVPYKLLSDNLHIRVIDTSTGKMSAEKTIPVV